jgi:hypothetical protein
MPGTATYKYRPEVGASTSEAGFCLAKGVHAVVNRMHNPPSNNIKMPVFVFMLFIFFIILSVMKYST